MLVSVNQLNGPQLTTFVVNAMSGTALSGALNAYFAGSGTAGPNFVYTYSDQTLTGNKTFLLSPIVPYSGGVDRAPSALFVIDRDRLLSGTISGQIGALSGFVLGTSGYLSANLSTVCATGSSIIQSVNLVGLGGTLVIWSGDQVFISGAAAGGGGGTELSVNGSGPYAALDVIGVGSVTIFEELGFLIISGDSAGSSTLSVTGSDPISSPNLTGAGSIIVEYDGTYVTISGDGGTINNTYNTSISDVTGNFVNMGFFFDEFSLATGLNQVEQFVGRSFFFTGYALGAINSGTQGFFSGSFYQRTPTNVKTRFIDFSLNSGLFFAAQGGFFQEVSGMNRVGLDIYRIGTGITGLSVGLFGVGY